MRRSPPPEKPSTALVTADQARRPEQGVFAARPDLADQAKFYAHAAESENTARARRSDWHIFEAWCSAQGVSPMPASVETVVGYLIDQAANERKATATVHRYFATLSSAHGLRGLPNPCSDPRCIEILRGIRRTHGVKQKLAAPITLEILELLRPHCDERDWAIICFGQATSCRRSELCAMDVEHLTIDERGVVVHLPRSKTDQEAKGRVIGVPRRPGSLCPVEAVQAWLRVLRRKTGPLFVALKKTRAPYFDRRLHPQAVCALIKHRIADAGLDSSKYSGHSLRAGYVTDARKDGKSYEEIKRQTGHQRLEILEGYSRYEPDPFTGK